MSIEDHLGRTGGEMGRTVVAERSQRTAPIGCSMMPHLQCKVGRKKMVAEGTHKVGSLLSWFMADSKPLSGRFGSFQNLALSYAKVGKILMHNLASGMCTAVVLDEKLISEALLKFTLGQCWPPGSISGTRSRFQILVPK